MIGAGASATDLAGLLNEAGAECHAGCPPHVPNVPYKFDGEATFLMATNSASEVRPRSWAAFALLLQRAGAIPVLAGKLAPPNCPNPSPPSGGWFAKDKVMGKVPLLLGQTLERAEVRDGKVRLLLRARDGAAREHRTDHVIAATGYKVDLERLRF